MPAPLACLSRADSIAAAFWTDLRPAFFQAVIAQWLLEGRTEEARFLDLRIQMRDRLGVIVFQCASTFSADFTFEWVVPSTIRAFDRKLELCLLMATLAPGAACPTIWHLLLLRSGAENSKT